jgi:hypothetical protein
VTFDLFDRVNRGGTRLNNQEMRNAIYQGASTKLLNKLSAFESFKLATENTITPRRMKDKYLILRLIAFYLWKQKQLLSVKKGEDRLPVDYRSDLEDFLGKTMMFLNDACCESFNLSLPPQFDKVMAACYSILGEGCFRLPPKKEGSPRRPISMALFEAVGYMMFEVIDQIPAKAYLIKAKYLELLQNKDFILSTTYTVDSNVSVYRRFEIVEQVIEEIKSA